MFFVAELPASGKSFSSTHKHNVSTKTYRHCAASTAVCAHRTVDVRAAVDASTRQSNTNAKNNLAILNTLLYILAVRTRAANQLSDDQLNVVGRRRFDRR
jgi:hypothetical protein